LEEEKLKLTEEMDGLDNESFTTQQLE